jgi:hypothetical protein
MSAGDPRRRAIGRAVFGTLIAAAVFFAFTATKHIKPLYIHAPWLNDPYDAVFSFTMFFVPLVVAVLLVQVSLCRKPEPLPAYRVIAILRGCRVVIAAIAVELFSAWAAVAVGANRSQWTAGGTGLQIALLIASTLVTGTAILYLRRAPHLREPDLTIEGQPADWLADVIAVAQRESRWLGPLRRSGLSRLTWADRAVVSRTRRHPLVAAAVASGAFAITVLGYQGLREQYSLSLTLLAIALGFCGMFVFLVIAGSYMRVVRSPTQLYGTRRRAVDATVAGCAAAIVALAFRDSLWWIIGTTTSASGTAQFATLVVGAALLSFAANLAFESLLRFHPRVAARR